VQAINFLVFGSDYKAYKGAFKKHLTLLRRIFAGEIPGVI